MVFNSNGIFKRAEGAAKKYTDAAKEEAEMLNNFLEKFEGENESKEGYAYAKLYTRKDGTGDVLVFSSKPDYVEASNELTLKEDYGNVGKEKYYARYKGESTYMRELSLPPRTHAEAVGSETHYATETIVDVKIVDKIKPISTAGWFCGCEELTTINLSNLDTSNVTDMSMMFAGCYRLQK